MKSLVTILSMILFLQSCNSVTTYTDKLTDNERRIIQNNIQESIRYIVRVTEELKIDSVLNYFNNPDFAFIGGDGKYFDFDDYSSMSRQLFESLKNLKFYRMKDHIQFLDRDHVVYTWFSKVDFYTNEGKHCIIKNLATTVIFKRIKNKWRCVFYQESNYAPEILVDHYG